MTAIQLQCHCGKVKGAATNITPKNGNHLVCCCKDCQQFAQFLDPNNAHCIVDAFGGTQIYQTSQSQVSIVAGHENVRCLRLTSKGLYRWYTECCNTPIGNTMHSKMPFIGLVHNFIRDAEYQAETLGPIRAYLQTRDAIAPPDYPFHSEKVPFSILLRIILQLLSWKVRGKGTPSCFFNKQGKAVVKPLILNKSHKDLSS